MTDDPSFHPTDRDLSHALRLMSEPGADRGPPPASLPDDGIGEAAALAALAPLILGGAQDLGAPTAFAHMDPPTPWVTWAATLWNASLNQNLLHPDVSPAARKIEQTVMDWIAPVFGMSGGHMTAGSTLANLTALWAARDLKGASRVITSSAAHLSVGKAAHLLGMEYIAVAPDAAGRLTGLDDAGDLTDAALVLTAGGTSTGAIDDLALAGRAAWTHIDAAWAGPLRFSDTFAPRLQGVEQADSVAISAHKWLFQPKESALILFRDAAAAHEAVSFGGAYLATPNVGVLGSRAAVAAPLMATLLAWGRRGLADRIDRAMAMADDLHDRLGRLPHARLFGPNATGVILWRDARVDGVDDLLSRLPPGMASKTRVDGRDWIRQVAANPNADIALIADHITQALAAGDTERN